MGRLRSSTSEPDDSPGDSRSRESRDRIFPKPQRSAAFPSRTPDFFGGTVVAMKRVMDNEISRLIVRLAVAVMRSDGSIDVPELKALRHLDDLGLGRISPIALEEIERATREPIDRHAVCDRLKVLAPQAGPVILATLATIAASDRSVPNAELWELRHISRALGVPDDVADEAFSPALECVRGREPSRPIEPRREVRREEIVAAYRRAIQRYNPEKVIHLGPEYAVLAVRRLARATEAFESAMAEQRIRNRP